MSITGPVCLSLLRDSAYPSEINKGAGSRRHDRCNGGTLIFVSGNKQIHENFNFGFVLGGRKIVDVWICCIVFV